MNLESINPKIMSLFITATNTDRGKTAWCQMLAAYLSLKNEEVLCMKPVQSGTPQGQIPLDLRWFADWFPDAYHAHQAHLCPHAFEAALSPHLAARLESKHESKPQSKPQAQTNENPSCESITMHYHALKKKAPQARIIVEGAGGIMVPINEQEWMLDVMKALPTEVILVAQPSLGTINDCVLSLCMLLNQKIPVRGFVFKETQKNQAPPFLWQDNARMIERKTGVPFGGLFSYLDDEAMQSQHACAQAFEQSLHPDFTLFG